MQIRVEGRVASKRRRYVSDQLDTFDSESRITSMARTTGTRACR